MDFKEVLTIFRNLQNDFPTIVKVEEVEKDEKIVLSLKDFSPKKEEIIHEVIVYRFDSPPNDLAECYQQNWERIEMFFFAGRYPLGSPDCNNTLNYLSNLAFKHFGVSVLVTNNSENETSTIICRSVVPLTKNPDTLPNDILLSIKDLLSLHYRVKFNNAIATLQGTGLDDDTENAIIEKYNRQLQQLINPLTDL